jgi:hypothetical protein
MKPGENIMVENIEHLGLVAGIINEIGLVEQINELAEGVRKTSICCAPNK